MVRFVKLHQMSELKSWLYRINKIPDFAKTFHSQFCWGCLGDGTAFCCLGQELISRRVKRGGLCHGILLWIFDMRWSTWKRIVLVKLPSCWNTWAGFIWVLSLTLSVCCTSTSVLSINLAFGVLMGALVWLAEGVDMRVSSARGLWLLLCIRENTGTWVGRDTWVQMPAQPFTLSFLEDGS